MVTGIPRPKAWDPFLEGDMLFAGIGVVLDGPLIFFEGRTPHF